MGVGDGQGWGQVGPLMNGFVFKPLPFLTLCTVGAFAVLLTLGFWQLDRRAWKNDLIAQLDARAAAEPVPLETALERFGTEIEALEFRKVTVRGTFTAKGEAAVYAHAGYGRPGHIVVTPLIRDGQASVFVNRGFAPMTEWAPRTAAQAQATSDAALGSGDAPRGKNQWARPEGPVTVTGVIRRPERANPFTPVNEPEAGNWYWMELEALTRHADLSRPPLPLIIEADPALSPEVVPVPGAQWRSKSTMPSLHTKHLGYAVTWFSLAAGLLVIWAAYHRALGRLGPPSGS